MGGLIVDRDRCVGCGLCVKVCANDGIEVVDRKARVLPGCIACGLCVEGCPVEALTIERGAGASEEELARWSGYLVVVETDRLGEPLPVALEITGEAARLARERRCGLTALVLSAMSGSQAPEALAAAGADKVLMAVDGRFRGPDVALEAQTVVDLVRDRRPEAVLFGATDLGRELAPMVAQALGTGLTADCTRLNLDPETGLLQQTRPAFGGNLMATIVCPAHRPQMATVRPGIFSAPEPREQGAVPVETIEVGEAPHPSPRVLSVEEKGDGASIADAEALVVVGRGVGDKKGVALAARLADALGAALGCSRPVVEAGWLDHSHQVGQTGLSVAPELMISVGVSGAVQHVAGIQGAKCIVAINEDADAPIFGSADYKVVGDCRQIMEAMVEKLEA